VGGNTPILKGIQAPFYFRTTGRERGVAEVAGGTEMVMPGTTVALEGLN